MFADAIGLYFRDRGADASEAIAAANAYTVEQEAGGMVLMKNENDTLPLKNTTKVNLFGALSAKQLYLGTGSAGGWNRDPTAFVNLKTALKEVDIDVNDTLWKYRTYPMLTNIVKGEWGFKGRMITDAGGTDSISCSVRAGLDMNLGFGGGGGLDSVEGLDNTKGYGLMRVQEAAKDQLYVFVNSSGITTVSTINNAWIAIPVVISIVLVAGAVLLFVFLVYPAFIMKKKEA